MRTLRSKIRHLTYKRYKNITLYHFRTSAWKEPEVKETLVKKASTKNTSSRVPVVICSISLLIVLAILLAFCLMRMN